MPENAHHVSLPSLVFYSNSLSLFPSFSISDRIEIEIEILLLTECHREDCMDRLKLNHARSRFSKFPQIVSGTLKLVSHWIGSIQSFTVDWRSRLIFILYYKSCCVNGKRKEIEQERKKEGKKNGEEEKRGKKKNIHFVEI